MTSSTNKSQSTYSFLKKDPGFYETQYDHGLQSKFVDAELLTKYKTLLGFFQKANTEANKFEVELNDQNKRVKKLEEDIDYYSKLIDFYEEFRIKMEKENESRLKFSKNLQAKLNLLKEEISEKPQKLVDYGLVVPPNFEKILGGVINLRWDGLDPKQLSLDQVFYKIKEEFKDLEERLDKEKEENKRLKQMLETPQHTGRRNSISKKERLSPPMTRKSILSNGSKKFGIKLETDSRDMPDTSLSPTKSLGPSFKFTQFKGQDHKMFSMGKLSEIENPSLGLLRAETLKNKPKDDDGVLETIEEAKSRVFSNRHLSRDSQKSEEISISDGADEEPQNTKQASRQKVLSAVEVEMIDVRERTDFLINELASYHKDLMDSYNYIRGFNPTYFEDD